jgi:glucose-6-phosphate 1-dehydrogenase
LELTTEENREKLRQQNLTDTKEQISYFHYAYDERELVEKLLSDIEKSEGIENLLIYIG